MATTTKNVSTTWTAVTAGGDYMVQNTGRGSINISMDGAPTSGSGIEIKPGQGLASNMSAGTVWARADKTGSIAVTE